MVYYDHNNILSIFYIKEIRNRKVYTYNKQCQIILFQKIYAIE